MNTGDDIRRNTRGSKSRMLWRKVTSFRETTIILIIIAIGIILSIMSPHFLTVDNFMSTAIGLSTDGIIVVGMTIVLVSGGFDFSAGSIVSLSSVTVGVLYLFGINIWLASVVALAAGLLCGLLNGFFIGKVGLNPFITTFAVMGITGGGSYVLTQGSPVSLFGAPDSFLFLGQGKLLGIPFIVIVFVIIAIIGNFMMKRSEPLRKIFYTGSNEKTALLSGIDTGRVKVEVYLLIAVLSSIAGILSIARFTVATPATGLGADASMRAISAAIIGGASLSGGEGTILGSVLGVILLNLINNGLILLNVPVYWQDFVNGVILISAVTLDYLSHHKQKRR